MKKRTIFVSVCFAVSLLGVLVTACSSSVGEPPVATATLTEVEATQESPGRSTSNPTPGPTALPGAITNLVEKTTETLGVEDTLILGLATQDWINLGISLLLILFGFWIAGSMTIRLLRRLVKRIPGTFDQAIFQRIEPQVKWLIRTLFLQFATVRLVFVSADVKTLLGHAYFVIYLVIIQSGLWRLVDLSIETYIRNLSPEKDAERLESLTPLVKRVLHLILLILGAQVLLGRFGIELGAMATALGIGGLAISLAAQDILGDLIAGFIILVSQPFRVGDRIEIQGLDTWGDVISIGARSTGIRTRDNRMVIVPNSIIGKSQIVNYTYPDPRYRVQIEIGIAYGTDIEKARRIIIETVGNVEGVLQDKPVDALYVAMGDSAMIFRIRWWIESYIDTRRNFDRVNTALQNALDAAGIEMPFPTQELNVRLKPDSMVGKDK